MKPDKRDTPEPEPPRRFTVVDTAGVLYMHYAVWDTQRQRPMAYSCRWVDAWESAKRFEQHPPYEPQE